MRTLYITPDEHFAAPHVARVNAERAATDARWAKGDTPDFWWRIGGVEYRAPCVVLAVAPWNGAYTYRIRLSRDVPGYGLKREIRVGGDRLVSPRKRP